MAKSRIKITIEGANGTGKTRIVKELLPILEGMGRKVVVYDPVYKFKPEEIQFGDAEVVIMVKTKNPKPAAEPEKA